MADSFDMPVEEVRWTKRGVCLIGTVTAGQASAEESFWLQSPRGGVTAQLNGIMSPSPGDSSTFDTASETASAGGRFMLLFSSRQLDMAALGFDRVQARSAKKGMRSIGAAGLRVVAASSVSYFRMALDARNLNMLCGYLWLATLAACAAIFHDDWGDTHVQSWQTQFYASEFFACLMVGWLAGQLASEKSTRQVKLRSVLAMGVLTGLVAVASGLLTAHNSGWTWFVLTTPLVALSIFGPRVWHAYKMIDIPRKASVPQFLQGALGALIFFFVPVAMAAQLRCDLVGRCWLIALDYVLVGGVTFAILYFSRYQYLKFGIEESDVH